LAISANHDEGHQAEESSHAQSYNTIHSKPPQKTKLKAGKPDCRPKLGPPNGKLCLRQRDGVPLAVERRVVPTAPKHVYAWFDPVIGASITRLTLPAS
jgi:hypothetical protein